MNVLKWILVFLIGLGFSSCNEGGEHTQEARSEPTEKAPPSDAIEVLNAEIIDDPNNPNLYVKRALMFRDRQMLDKAIRDAQRAIAIDSTVSYFRTVLGKLYFQNANLRGARLNLERAAALDKTNTDALLKLGETDFLLRRYEEALTAVNDALRQNDKLAQGYFIKGYIYKELGDTALSKSSFHTAVEVDPSHYESYLELGRLEAYQGNPLALTYFNTAITIRPQSTEALYNKGMFLQAGGKYHEAMDVYRKIIEVDPDGFLGYYNAGYLNLTEFQKYDSALYYFDQVLRLQPGYIDALLNKGVSYEQKGETRKAVEIYREVLAINPDYTLAAKGLERLLE